MNIYIHIKYDIYFNSTKIAYILSKGNAVN